MKKVPKPKRFILREEAHHEQFALYHFSGKFEEFHAFLRNKKYTTSSTDISYRMINHWQESGLLPDGVDSEGWSKFTLVELVWMKAILKLRSFGLSLDKIRLAKGGLMEFDKKKKSYFLFEYYIARALLSSDDPYILVFADGDSAVATSSQIELSKVFMGQFDVLLISLKSIIENLGFDIMEAKLLHSLDGEEDEIFNELKSGNKKVSVRMNNGKISELETTKVYSDPELIKKINKEIQENDSFAEVITRYSKGKRQSAEVKVKKRFNRSDGAINQ